VELYEIKSLTFRYPSRDMPALDNISLSFERGGFCTIFGESGCGKTTLLRHLKTILTPNGERSGEIVFKGRPIGGVSVREQAGKIGFVMQSPESQIVTDKVWHELAFGLENLGFPQESIRLRTAEAADYFGLSSKFFDDVATLSGGEKQLLNLAAAVALGAEVLILDEPTARLDPVAAGRFLSELARLNRDLGTTVILSEQRLDEVFPFSGRAVAMSGGRIAAVGSPRDVAAAVSSCERLRLSLPAPARILARLGEAAPPVSLSEGRDMLEENYTLKKCLAATGGSDEAAQETPGIASEPAQERLNSPVVPRLRAKNIWNGTLPGGKSRPQAKGRGEDLCEPVLTLKDIFFRYEKSSPDILHGLSLSLFAGELAAVVGANGAGKSTLLWLAAGLLRPLHGGVKARGRTALLPQDAQTLFAKDTVLEELSEVPGAAPSEIEETARGFGLSNLLVSHPYDLSGGETQRLALAKLLLAKPDILLLDEPTKGMDAFAKKVLAGILGGLKREGKAILTVSHDVDFCAEVCDRAALLFGGSIIAEGPPRAVFAGNNFYTTNANRLARGICPGALTDGDVVDSCERK